MSTPAAPAPPVGEFRKIPDLFDQLAALNRLADVMGWRFPPEHAAERRAVLRQIRRLRCPDGRRYSLAAIASRVSLGKTRLWQLLKAETRVGSDLAADPAHECAPPPVLPEPEPLVPARSHMTAGGGDIQTLPAVAAVTS